VAQTIPPFFFLFFFPFVILQQAIGRFEIVPVGDELEIG